MHYHNVLVCHVKIYAELHRDKRIARDNEFSDSDDEGESPSSGRRGKTEQSHKTGNKRPKLIEDPSAKSASNGKPSQKQGVVASPLPPEPSPITPLPTEEPTPSHSKGECIVWYMLHVCTVYCT